ncbi:MAG: N-acetylneuraminate synthase [Elusimicrobia bacterium]|nr:N-acetylneuraminate synthase [Elusimicrobiota bacterium]
MHPKNKIAIGTRWIGPGESTFIIAEAGSNHNGDVELGKRLIEAAKAAGADAIKFQKFFTEELVLPDAPKARYQIATTGSKENQFQMLKHLELGKSEFQILVTHAQKTGILFFASVFDHPSVDFMMGLGTPAIKIGSGDTNNLPLIQKAAKTGLPILLSTGMSILEEIDAAIACIEQTGNEQVLLFHCVSSYPTPYSSTNLRIMETLRKRYPYPIGYSDHTLGITAPLAAVALGAVSIEKHFTLDKKLAGPDHSMSIDPDELKTLVSEIRNVEQTLGHSEKEVLEVERDILSVARKSLVAKITIPQGTTITEEMISIRRPASGISPACLKQVLGKKAPSTIPAGQMLPKSLLLGAEMLRTPSPSPVLRTPSPSRGEGGGEGDPMSRGEQY